MRYFDALEFLKGRSKMLWISARLSVFLVVAAMLLTGPAVASSPLVLPMYDGFGTPRLDGSGAVETGATVAQLYTGFGSSWRDVPGADMHGGFGVVARPFAAVELGVGVSEFRQHPSAGRGPDIVPGRFVMQFRRADLPFARGLTLSSSWGIPLYRRRNCAAPWRTEWLVAGGRSLGPLRLMANLVLSASSWGRVAMWGGFGGRYLLPYGLIVSADAVLPIYRGYAIGVSASVPIAAGFRFMLDLQRYANVVDGPKTQLSFHLSFRTLSRGGALAYRADHDEDGLRNDIDSCPRQWAQTPDGCPERAVGAAAAAAAAAAAPSEEPEE